MTTAALGPPAATNARPRILAAALECFSEFGYEKSSMKRIAARAGVSQPLLHHHFDTKERLIQSAIEQMAADMFSSAADQLPQQGSAAERLDFAAELLYALFVNNLRAATFVVEFAAAANHNDALRQPYLAYQQIQRDNIVSFVQELAPGAESAVSVELIETFLLGMAMRRPFTTDQSAFRAGFDVHVRLLINHLIAQGTEHPAP
ncbi:MAG: helix-turn-helix domain-containing protein [Mycobacterium sp.]|uniref:TetR/AcrR family transcriptional regulator n=1 Tax=Mycobacterium sp. TaxID=1785 RepID=UPI003BAE6AE2